MKLFCRLAAAAVLTASVVATTGATAHANDDDGGPSVIRHCHVLTVDFVTESTEVECFTALQG
ncbi:hypothetical protein ACIGEZ_19410 [Streptomyces sp. NPDC085481]|uniref:hypothetical protein n=1 Tax=Streptomyces sp. NPDC085481 TaxID=3365727 RepID=UPI0037CDCAE7